jgi:hypothetical protein
VKVFKKFLQTTGTYYIDTHADMVYFFPLLTADIKKDYIFKNKVFNNPKIAESFVNSVLQELNLKTVDGLVNADFEKKMELDQNIYKEAHLVFLEDVIVLGKKDKDNGKEKEKKDKDMDKKDKDKKDKGNDKEKDKDTPKNLYNIEMQRQKEFKSRWQIYQSCFVVNNLIFKKYKYKDCNLYTQNIIVINEEESPNHSHYLELIKYNEEFPMYRYFMIYLKNFNKTEENLESDLDCWLYLLKNPLLNRKLVQYNNIPEELIFAVTNVYYLLNSNASSKELRDYLAQMSLEDERDAFAAKFEQSEIVKKKLAEEKEEAIEHMEAALEEKRAVLEEKKAVLEEKRAVLEENRKLKERLKKYEKDQKSKWFIGRKKCRPQTYKFKFNIDN